MKCNTTIVIFVRFKDDCFLSAVFASWKLVSFVDLKLEPIISYVSFKTPAALLAIKSTRKTSSVSQRFEVWAPHFAAINYVMLD